MIPVTAAPEPATFDAAVRQKGVAWLASKNLTGVTVKPAKLEIPSYWTDCLPDLFAAYDRICAYASLKIHPVTGAHSVEHFAPKSQALDIAYEWSNYRLVCAKLNSRKRDFTDVLDPFALAPDTFRLNVLNGAIEIAPWVAGQALTDAKATIDRLGLDDAELRKARLEYVDGYLAKDFTEKFLKSESPFIWTEMKRQNLL